MAIRAQELEILHAVVAPVTVQVVQLERQRLATPLGDPTVLAHRLLQSIGEQAPVQVVPVALGALRGEAVLALGPRPRLDVPALDRLAPAGPRESVLLLAFAHRAGRFVVRADLAPVVAPAEPRVSLDPEAAQVEADRWLRDAQSP